MGNYIFNLFQQIFNLAVNVFLSSYLSRVLGPDSYGTFTYLITVANFLILFASFGASNYGPKLLVQGKYEDSFSILTTFNLITSASIGVVIFISFLFNKIDQSQFLFLFFYVSSMSLNWSWYFMAKNKYSVISYITIPLKIINVILVLLFVHSPNSINQALLVSAIISILISLLILFVILTENRPKLVIKRVNLYSKEIILLFIPFILISIYTVMDKLMLGNLSTMSELSIYSNSMVLLKTSLVLITAATPIFMTKVAANYNNENEISRIIESSLKYGMYISFFLISCFLFSSDEIVYILYGENYLEMIDLLVYFSPIIFFIAISTIISGQYFIGASKIKPFITIVAIGAIVNFFLNIILMPKFGAAGGFFATLVAEIIITALSIFSIRKIVKIRLLLLYFVSSFTILLISIEILQKINIENLIFSIITNSIISAIIFVFSYIIIEKGISYLKGNLWH